MPRQYSCRGSRTTGDKQPFLSVPFTHHLRYKPILLDVSSDVGSTMMHVLAKRSSDSFHGHKGDECRDPYSCSCWLAGRGWRVDHTVVLIPVIGYARGRRTILRLDGFGRLPIATTKFFDRYSTVVNWRER